MYTYIKLDNQKVVAHMFLNKVWKTPKRHIKPKQRKYISSPLKKEISLNELQRYNEYLHYKKKIYLLSI